MFRNVASCDCKNELLSWSAEHSPLNFVETNMHNNGIPAWMLQSILLSILNSYLFSLTKSNNTEHHKNTE